MSEPEVIRIEPVPKQNRLLLTAQDAAEMLSVSRETIDKLPILRHTIKGIKGVRYRMIDLQEYVRSLGS